MLGLTVEDFVRVMEENKVPVKERDGTCFGNLAFCPSLEKPSRDRDEALLKMRWGLRKYLSYKFELLKKLLPPDKLDFAFSTRLLRQYAVEALDLETRKMYRALALGNIKSGMLMITEVFRESDLKDKQVESILYRTEFVGVRIPRDLESRSDGIRRALMLYLNALGKTVKQRTKVKP